MEQNQKGSDYFEKYVAMCHFTEQLKKRLKEHNLKKEISEKDILIGKLSSYIEELKNELVESKHKIKKLNKKIHETRIGKNIKLKKKIEGLELKVKRKEFIIKRLGSGVKLEDIDKN